MLKSINVRKLQGRLDIDVEFHPDINIVTGINGSGKTTLLKLIWYLISGNVERIFQELSFQMVTLKTTYFDLILQAEGPAERPITTITHVINGSPHLFRMPNDKLAEEPDQVGALNARIAEAVGGSVFFPTFRRIEGGFSIGLPPVQHRRPIHTETGLAWMYGPAGPAGLDTAMKELSGRISVRNHTFVASISTDDIAQLLTTRYAAASESTNQMLTDVARQLLTANRDVQNGKGPSAEEVLKQIAVAAENVERQQNALLKPFTVLSKLVSDLYQSKGIAVGRSLTLGDTKGAIRSDMLSAGEKQMLSFLVYNAFTEKAPIFIDEPEISLHVDWQRRLFPLLLEQATDNQFFVATHSPFIYQKYADKEIMLSNSRGE